MKVAIGAAPLSVLASPLERPSHRAVPPRAGQTAKMSEVDVLKITNEDAAFILGKGGRTSNASPSRS